MGDSSDHLAHAREVIRKLRYCVGRRTSLAVVSVALSVFLPPKTCQN